MRDWDGGKSCNEGWRKSGQFAGSPKTREKSVASKLKEGVLWRDGQLYTAQQLLLRLLPPLYNPLPCNSYLVAEAGNLF